MAFPKTVGFSRRVADHVTDELVSVLSGGEIYEFKELFLKVYEGLKVRKAVSGGEEMLRLRCYEKLQRLSSRGMFKRPARPMAGSRASSRHPAFTNWPGLMRRLLRVSPPPVEIIIQKTHSVKKPNYQFEKRRRDLEKKAKKEEKRLRKLEKPANPDQPAVTDTDPPSPPSESAVTA